MILKEPGVWGMKRYSKSMDSMWSCLLLVLMLLLVLTGCSRQPTISEGSLYLQAQIQQAKIQNYQATLQRTKDKLTQVLPVVLNDNPQVPVSLLAELTDFLANNDCTQLADRLKDQCFRVTRVKLINTTQALDQANANLYAGQKTVGQLITNISVLVDTMVPPEEVAKPSL